MKCPRCKRTRLSWSCRLCCAASATAEIVNKDYVIMYASKNYHHWAWHKAKHYTIKCVVNVDDFFERNSAFLPSNPIGKTTAEEAATDPEYQRQRIAWKMK